MSYLLDFLFVLLCESGLVNVTETLCVNFGLFRLIFQGILCFFDNIASAHLFLNQ